MAITKKDWEQFVPNTIRLPGGYSIKIRVMAESTMKKLGGDVYGVFYDYGEPIPTRGGKGDPRVSHIFLNRCMTNEQFIEKFGHELIHAFIDWHGIYANKVRDKLGCESD